MNFVKLVLVSLRSVELSQVISNLLAAETLGLFDLLDNFGLFFDILLPLFLFLVALVIFFYQTALDLLEACHDVAQSLLS